MNLPPMPPRPDMKSCRWCPSSRYRIAFDLPPRGIITALTPLPNGLMICMVCDMGNASAGPPVLLDYLKRGHQ